MRLQTPRLSERLRRFTIRTHRTSQSDGPKATSNADEALAAEWLVDVGSELKPDVYVPRRELDESVARLKLEAMGASLETLTGEQANYLESWEEGT